MTANQKAKQEARRIANKVNDGIHERYGMWIGQTDAMTEMILPFLEPLYSAQEERDRFKAKLDRLSRLIEAAEQQDDAKSEAEIAASASFIEAMAHTNADMVAEERDKLRSENEALKKKCAHLEANVSPVDYKRAYEISCEEREAILDGKPEWVQKLRSENEALREVVADSTKYDELLSQIAVLTAAVIIQRDALQSALMEITEWRKEHDENQSRNGGESNYQNNYEPEYIKQALATLKGKGVVV